MIVSKSLNSPGYTAFQPSNSLRIGVSHKTHEQAVIKHCGYIADAETESKAIDQLYEVISQLRPVQSALELQGINP